MDPKISRDKDCLIDLETGTGSLIDERQEPQTLESNPGQPNNLFGKVWIGFAGADGSIQGEEAVNLGQNGESLTSPENKKKKKGSKKPPKPPRPPKSPSLDASDQKLIKELSELAMLKRARMERMKALKKMKNAKAASPNGNLYALVTTIIFCILIIWQGFSSRGSSSVTFRGSPESSVGPSGGLISVQFYKEVSREGPHHGSSSASPYNLEQISGLDDQGEGRRMVG